MHPGVLAFPTPSVLEVASSMQIVSIQKAVRGRERLVLRLDNGEEVELAEEVILRTGMREGEAVSAEILEEALRQDVDWRAREASLRLLSHRPRTESELRIRLARKGFPADAVERCVAGLLEKRLLDDAAFAAMFTRDRVRLSPRGRARVMRELRGKGVKPEIVGAVLDEVFEQEEVDELGLAREAAQKWHPRQGEDPMRARRRLTGFLARRGFPAEAVRRVVDEKLRDEGSLD